MIRVTLDSLLEAEVVGIVYSLHGRAGLFDGRRQHRLGDLELARQDTCRIVGALVFRIGAD